MSDERGMTVHFVDGTKLKLSFPKQVKTDEAVSIRLEKLLDKPALLRRGQGGEELGKQCMLEVLAERPDLADALNAAAQSAQSASK